MIFLKALRDFFFNPSIFFIILFFCVLVFFLYEGPGKEIVSEKNIDKKFSVLSVHYNTYSGSSSRYRYPPSYVLEISNDEGKFFLQVGGEQVFQKIDLSKKEIDIDLSVITLKDGEIHNCLKKIVGKEAIEYKVFVVSEKNNRFHSCSKLLSEKEYEKSLNRNWFRGDLRPWVKITPL